MCPDPTSSAGCKPQRCVAMVLRKVGARDPVRTPEQFGPKFMQTIVSKNVQGCTVGGTATGELSREPFAGRIADSLLNRISLPELR